MLKGIVSRLQSSGLFRIRTRIIFMFVAGLAVSMIVPVQAQDTDEFKPGGKAEVRIFTGFNTTFSDGENHTKFDVTRAYLGYGYNFSRTLSGRVVYDVADPSVGKLQFTGMLKFAYLKYQTDKWTVTGGMIPLPEFAHADKKWGYRYIYKPSHDAYGFGTAADLGLSVAYNIAPWITADVTLMNGEGFKLMEADSTLKTAVGVTLIPLSNFSLRGYFDNMGRDGLNQQTAEVIASYESKGSMLSAAWHYRKNHGLITGHDYHAISFNGRIPVSDKVTIIGRYDFAASPKIGSEPDPWNLSKDGQLFLAAVEIVLSKGVSLAPNYQGWKPASGDMPFISRFSLSLDLKI
ncbi:MAG: hypothetical protein IH592_02010 [Bacteroidales bacterium]|nr:hypothetical protein [Bacteroidales bacterium]